MPQPDLVVKYKRDLTKADFFTTKAISELPLMFTDRFLVEDKEGEKVILPLLQQFHLLAKKLNGALGYKEFMRMPKDERLYLVDVEWAGAVKDEKEADRMRSQRSS